MSHASELGRMTGSLVFEKMAIPLWDPRRYDMTPDQRAAMARGFNRDGLPAVTTHEQAMKAPVSSPFEGADAGYRYGQRQSAIARAERSGGYGVPPRKVQSAADWRRVNQQRLEEQDNIPVAQRQQPHTMGPKSDIPPPARGFGAPHMSLAAKLQRANQNQMQMGSPPRQAPSTAVAPPPVAPLNNPNSRWSYDAEAGGRLQGKMAPPPRPFNNPNSNSYRPSGPSTAAGPQIPRSPLNK